MEISEKMKEVYEHTRPVIKELGEWIEAEEVRLNREMTDEEIDKKRDELNERFGLTEYLRVFRDE